MRAFVYKQARDECLSQGMLKQRRARWKISTDVSEMWKDSALQGGKASKVLNVFLLDNNCSAKLLLVYIYLVHNTYL